jgi:hypothetical protein
LDFAIRCADFEEWAGKLARRSAQEEFPRLLRLLVFATNTTVELIDFPAGDSIVFPGWDGVTEARGASVYVPSGTTAWELGTTSDYKEKAWEDYQKRSAEPVGPNGTPLSQCTFIIVTPRQWIKDEGPYKHRQTKQKWAQARKAEGIWGNVKVYDANDLEAWLEQAPAVTDWFRVECGKPNGVYSLEHWLRSWRHSSYPYVSEESVLGKLSNRDQLAARIHSWLAAPKELVANPADDPNFDSPPRLLTVRCEGTSRLFVLANFAVAFLKLFPSADDLDKLLCRMVVVEDLTAWRRLVRNHPPLIMIPLFGHHGEVHLAAKDHGHHVLLPLSNSREWPDPAVFNVEIIAE